MKLQVLKNLITSKTARQVLKLQKHSPAILFVAGAVGVGATVVLACRATLKVEGVLDEHARMRAKIEMTVSPLYSEEDRQKDRITLFVQTGGKLAKLYAFPAVLGTLSIVALTSSHVILARRNAALAAAYLAVDKAFKEYRERVRLDVGDDKDLEYRYGLVDKEIVEETPKGPVVKTIKALKDGERSMYAVCFAKETSQEWSPQHGYNRMFLKCQQNWANDLLQARGHVFLNEVYDMIGIERTPAGQSVGWVLGNGNDYVDFGVFRNDEFMGQQFVNGTEGAVWLDFNVDGPIWNLI